MIESWTHLLNRPEIRFEQEILASAVRGKRVLITGAAGSIGAALTRVIASSGPAHLALLDSHEASLFHLRQRMDDVADCLDVRYVLADLRDRSKVSQVFRRGRIDVTFHLAAYKHVPLAEDNVDQVAAVNLLGTLNVVEAAIEHGGSTVVYPSSDKAVTALSAYAATKRIAEQVLQSLASQHDRPRLRVVRLVNVAGTQGSVAETFARQARSNLPLSITDPRMDRYWMTMSEATHLLLAVATRPTFEGFYMLDVGEPVGIAETARRVYRMVHPEGGQPTIRVTGIRPGERLHEELKRTVEFLRTTEIPGLLVAVAPPPTFDARSWLDELARFRDCAYEREPAEIKAWLLDLATRASPNDDRLSTSLQTPG